MTKVRYSRNSRLERIRQEMNEPETFRAVARFVDKYREAGERLEDIGAKLGVVGIVEQKLAFEGGIFPNPAGYIIKINSLSPPTRKRFTLAHELAHLLISPKTASSARRCLKSSDLETACDVIAAELLMPESMVLGSIGQPASLDSLILLARRSSVSIQAAAVRICDLGLWRESIGFWKWDKGARELWWVGRRFWTDYQPPFVAFEQAVHIVGVVRTKEFYSDSEGTHAVSLEVKRMGQDYLIGLALA